MRPTAIEIVCHSSDSRFLVFEIVSQDASAIPFQSEGQKMPRRTTRLSADADERLQAMAKDRGYATPSALLRAAIRP
jgi:hypothetical protein